MEWSKKKYKVFKNQPAKRICEMDVTEAALVRGHAHQLSNACGFADDGRGQNHWIGVECECEARIKQLNAG